MIFEKNETYNGFEIYSTVKQLSKSKFSHNIEVQDGRVNISYNYDDIDWNDLEMYITDVESNVRIRIDEFISVEASKTLKVLNYESVKQNVISE